jgi:hypothetical protein
MEIVHLKIRIVHERIEEVRGLDEGEARLVRQRGHRGVHA